MTETPEDRTEIHRTYCLEQTPNVGMYCELEPGHDGDHEALDGALVWSTDEEGVVTIKRNDTPIPNP